ncbi:MAG: cytochrome c [Fibrobacteria bacterium]|nr:cytochrome c [Fibrobacteria bacterium]
MNFLVFVPVIALLIALRFTKLSILLWQFVIFAACFILLKFGFTKPLPMSVVNLFSGIIAVSLFAYLSFDNENFSKSLKELKTFITERQYALWLKIVIIVIPIGFGVNVYIKKSQGIKPPVFGRSIHPAPPTSTSFRGKTIDLVAGENPFRPLKATNPDSFLVHVDNGERVYCEQCSYCHGGNMESKGLFAHALDPIPIKFADKTILPDLQESFLFWRIAKGGPDLPDEAAPWASSMPAFEPFLTENEIWDVLLYMYEFNGMTPRAISAHAGGGGGEH